MNRIEVLERLEQVIQGLQRNKDLIENGIRPGNEEWLDCAGPFNECMNFLGNQQPDLIDADFLKAGNLPPYWHDLEKESPTENALILKEKGVWIENYKESILTVGEQEFFEQLKRSSISRGDTLSFYKQIGIDDECLEICYAMNSLPGVSTIESCCGHYKDPYRIWFKCTNSVSLAILSRVVCRRYSTGKFVIKVGGSDVCPRNEFLLESVKTFKCPDEMEKEIEIFLDNFKHWTDDAYKDYFTMGDIRRKLG